MARSARSPWTIVLSGFVGAVALSLALAFACAVWVSANDVELPPVPADTR